MAGFIDKLSEVEQFNTASNEDKLKFGDAYATTLAKKDKRFQDNPEAQEFLRQKIQDEIQASFPEPTKFLGVQTRIEAPTREEFFSDVSRVVGPGIAGLASEISAGFEADIRWLETVGERTPTENLGAIGNDLKDIMLHTLGAVPRAGMAMAQIPHIAASWALEQVGLAGSTANQWLMGHYEGLQLLKNELDIIKTPLSQIEEQVIMAKGIGAVMGGVVHGMTTKAYNTAKFLRNGTPGFSARDARIITSYTTGKGEVLLVAPGQLVIDRAVEESTLTTANKAMIRAVAPVLLGLFSGFTYEMGLDKMLRNPNVINTISKMTRAGATPAEVADAIVPDIIKAPSFFDDVVKATNGRVPIQEIGETYGKKITMGGRFLEDPGAPIIGKLPKPVKPAKEALEELLGPVESTRFSDMGLGQLIPELNYRYPDVVWGKMGSTDEMLEGFASKLAQEQNRPDLLNPNRSVDLPANEVPSIREQLEIKDARIQRKLAEQETLMRPTAKRFSQQQFDEHAKVNKEQMILSDQIDQVEEEALGKLVERGKVDPEIQGMLNDVEMLKSRYRKLVHGEEVRIPKEQSFASDTVDAVESYDVVRDIMRQANEYPDELGAKNFYLTEIDNAYRTGKLTLADARRASTISLDSSRGTLFDLSGENMGLNKLGLTGQVDDNLQKQMDIYLKNEDGLAEPQALKQVSLHAVPLMGGFEVKDGELQWNANKYLKYGAAFVALGIGGKFYRRVGVHKVLRSVGSDFNQKFWGLVDHPKYNHITMCFRKGSGLDPELYKLKQVFKKQKNRLVRETTEFTELMRKRFTVEEREALSDFIEKEGNDWANVPDVLKQQADEITTMLGKIRGMLIDSGVNEEIVTKFGDRWLHRVYIPELMKKPAYKDMQRGLKAMHAHYVMRRGKNFDLDFTHMDKMGLTEKDFVKGDKLYSFLDAESKKVWVHGSQEDMLKAARQTLEGERAWDVINTNRGKITANTDFTRAERQMMGEARDVALRLGVFFREAADDIALGNLYKNIGDDPRFMMRATKGLDAKTLEKAAKEAGFVRMSDKTAASGVKKFGTLSGEWVHPDVERLLGRMTKQRYTEGWGQAYNLYKMGLTGWKISKTAYNPSTHMLNIATNFHLAFMAGHDPFTMVGEGISLLIKKGRFYQEALEEGLIESGILHGEYNLDAYLKGVNGLLDESDIPKAMMALRKSYNVVKGVAKLPLKVYQWEDEIFKLGMYSKLRRQGVSPADAMAKANEWFFDYSDVPAGVEFLRDSGIMPFISFTYKVVPAMIRGTVDRPERLAALLLMYKAINDLSYSEQFGEKAEAQAALEREVRPEFQRKRMFGVGPDPQIRLTNDERTGEARTLDVGRFIPGADMFADMQDAFPFGMHPAISMAYGLKSGKHATFGNNIMPYPDAKNSFQESQNFDGIMKFIVNSTLPNIPFIPYTYSHERIGNGLVADGTINENSGWLWDYSQRMGWTGKNYFGHDVNLVEEIISSFGLKVSRMDVQQATAQEFERRERGFGQATRDLNRALTERKSTPARRKAAVEGYKEQVEQTSEEQKTLLKLLRATK